VKVNGVSLCSITLTGNQRERRYWWEWGTRVLFKFRSLLFASLFLFLNTSFCSSLCLSEMCRVTLDPPQQHPDYTGSQFRWICIASHLYTAIQLCSQHRENQWGVTLQHNIDWKPKRAEVLVGMGHQGSLQGLVTLVHNCVSFVFYFVRRYA
jgi:hypothetical protein